ncbi:MAG: hypothetical protein ABJB66_12310 [Gemmatimonadaceae bacterium]
MKRAWMFLTLALVTGVLFACTTPDATPVTFELCTVNPDSSFVRPAMLSGADLSSVKAVSKSAWYVLSGSHTQSKIILTIRPERVKDWLLATRFAVQEGSRIAIVIDGKSIGQLMWMKPPEGNELEIDASFFSSGNEDSKLDATKALAKRIKASMK